jgi:hypothetical protein
MLSSFQEKGGIVSAWRSQQLILIEKASMFLIYTNNPYFKKKNNPISLHLKSRSTY